MQTSHGEGEHQGDQQTGKQARREKCTLLLPQHVALCRKKMAEKGQVRGEKREREGEIAGAGIINALI